MALKTNSKALRQKIRGLVTENYNSYVAGCVEGFESTENWAIISKNIKDLFYVEKVKNDYRYKAGKISRQDLFYDWAQGLTSGLPTEIFLTDSVEYLGDILEQTQAERERFDDMQACRCFVNLIYRELGI